MGVSSHTLLLPDWLAHRPPVRYDGVEDGQQTQTSPTFHSKFRLISSQHPHLYTVLRSTKTAPAFAWLTLCLRCSGQCAFAEIARSLISRKHFMSFPIPAIFLTMVSRSYSLCPLLYAATMALHGILSPHVPDGGGVGSGINSPDSALFEIKFSQQSQSSTSTLIRIQHQAAK